jgi:CubicO group peptidase (beta-lactamase class C family)
VRTNLPDGLICAEHGPNIIAKGPALTYARFGRLYLEGGAREGRQIVPADWVATSVAPTAPHLQPGDNPASHWTFGYGYKWWISEEPQGDFLAIGVWGQYIYVDP